LAITDASDGEVELMNSYMKRIITGLLAVILIFASSFLAGAAENLPAASNLLQRLLTRAELIAKAGESNHYAYEKRAVMEELDEKDRVIKSTEKHYRVELIGGLPFPRLVKIQGRELSAKELEKENQRETAFRQRVTRVDMSKKARRKEGLATQDLVDRFDFRVTKREEIEGRSTLVMTFAPRAGAPDKTMEDKIFQKVFGTVWVDEDEAEVAKLDASVRGPVPLGWFGAVGSLNKFQATVERSRMPDGVWVNRKSSFWIAARKLLSAIRTRTTEESSGFRRSHGVEN
jgi:hypothetical protein